MAGHKMSWGVLLALASTICLARIEVVAAAAVHSSSSSSSASRSEASRRLSGASTAHNGNDDKLTSFQSSLLLSHTFTTITTNNDGEDDNSNSNHNNRQDLTETELAFLEDLLVETYNNNHRQQASREGDSSSSSSSSSDVISYCDPYQRQLSSADATEVRYTHEELETLHTSSTTTTVQVQYNLQGSCSQCEDLSNSDDDNDKLFSAKPAAVAATATTTLLSSLQRLLFGVADEEEPQPLASSSSIIRASLRSGDAVSPQQQPKKDCEPRAIQKEELIQAMNSNAATGGSASTVSIRGNTVTTKAVAASHQQRKLQLLQMQSLIEVDQYDCSAPTERFTTTVYLRVPTTDSSSSSIMMMEGLEQSFQSAYNNLTFALCDSTHFRQIISVTVAADNSSSNSSSISSMVPAQEALDAVWDLTKDNNNTAMKDLANHETTILVLHVETECQNCDATTPLFHPVPYLDTGEDMTAATTSSGGDSTTTTSAIGGSLSFPFAGGSANSVTRSISCICRKDDDNVFRAPTADEFRMQFNSYSASTTTTQGGVGDRLLPLLLQVDEDQRMDCSAAAVTSTSTFHSHSHVSLDVPLVVNDSDKAEATATLEQAFLETYNQLSYIYCDEFHRTIINVTLLEDTEASNPEGSQQQESHSNQEASELHLERSMYFRIEGRCVDCPITDGQSYTLFSDSTTNAAAVGGGRGQQRRLLLGSSIPSPSRSRKLGRSDQDEDLCLCAPGVEPGSRGLPSEEAFHIVFNENLKKLPSFEAVEQVTEGWEVPCSEDISVFESAVLANVNLYIDALTEEEITVLEETFLEVYNSMAYLSCDGHFRRILTVTVATPLNEFGESNATSTVPWNVTLVNNTFSLDWENADAGTSLPALFSVTSRCRDCNVSEVGSYTLFDNNALGRFLPGRALSTSRALPGRHLQKSTDQCLCPVGSRPGSDQGPILEDFQRELNQRVTALKSQGILRSAQSYQAVDANMVNNVTDPLMDLVEVHPVPCSSNLTRFQSAVYTGLRVDELELNQDEILRIENSFKRLYNNLSFAGCDEHFRTIANVEMVIGNVLGGRDRRLQDVKLLNETTDLIGINVTENNRTVFEPTMFVVTGECRNCPVSRSGSFNLFDDVFRRALSEVLASSDTRERDLVEKPKYLEHNQRNLFEMGDDVCYCPAGLLPQLGPPSSTFGSLFDTLIQEATVDAGVEVSFGAAGQRIAEVDISCTAMELEIVEGSYAVAIPTAVMALPATEFANFINYAMPRAYNLVTEGDCSPVVLEATVVGNRRLLDAGDIVDRTVKVLTIQPARDAALFSSPEHKIRVAEKLYELFINSQFARAVPLVLTSTPSLAPTTSPTVRTTEAPTEPKPPPTPRPTDRPTTRRPTTPNTPRPTVRRTPRPTASPTKKPTSDPTLAPSTGPSIPPSDVPSVVPTMANTTTPSSEPSKSPTSEPSGSPTRTYFEISRLVLIDCSTSKPVLGYEDLQGNVVLNRTLLPELLTIEAITEPGEISQVKFFFDGEMIQSESKLPYSMSSNNGDGSFKPSERLDATGITHTLKAVCSWWFGFEGVSAEITITVI